MKKETPDNTAILIFARTPNADFRDKNIAGGPGLFKALNRQILSTVKKSGLPYFFIDESMQVGDDFASRFTNALALLFSRGYENVISVGNDSPDLKRGHLQLAITQLREGNAVIGPSRDGGIYLMGIPQTSFYAGAFLALPWQTPRLKSALRRLLNIQGLSVLELETFTDLDTSADLKAMATRFTEIPRAISTLLRELFKTVVSAHHPRLFKESLTAFSLPHNKGSPSRDYL